MALAPTRKLMRTANPNLQLVAFGLNVVDHNASEYAGYSVPPLVACVADAASYSRLAGLSGLSATVYSSGYSGVMSALGDNVPPYRLTLDCTREMVRSQIAARAAAVKAGDLSIICISGHGAQERYILEAIESLVLTDGLMPDYEFHDLIALFPAGARVAVFLDTCHSGGMDRLASFTHRRKAVAPVERNGLRRGAARALKPIQADVVFFKACGANQTALDGQHNGAFTGSVMQAAQAVIDGSQGKSWIEVMARAADLCEKQFNQKPDTTFYGDLSTWHRPFFT
jgi:hypothetical protein